MIIFIAIPKDVTNELLIDEYYLRPFKRLNGSGEIEEWYEVQKELEEGEADYLRTLEGVKWTNDLISHREWLHKNGRIPQDG